MRILDYAFPFRAPYKFNINSNRQITDQERRLARWMLENGSPGAIAFLPQLDQAEVTDWKCECGCASTIFQIRGLSIAPPGAHVIADFLLGDGDTTCGNFIFESGGTLSGLEVFGLASDAPKLLPQPEELRPFADSNRN